MAIPGKNAGLYVYVSSSYTKAAQGKDITFQVQGKTIDTTNFDDSEWESFINGPKGWTLSFKGNFVYTDAQQVALMNNILNASQGTLAIEYRLTASAAPKFSGNVVVESFGVPSSVGDAIQFDVSLKGSGACTFTAS